MESMLIHTIYIIVIVCKIIATISEDEQYELKKLIHKIIKVGATTKNGYTMLHLCVDSDTPVDSFHTEDVCQYVIKNILLLLLLLIIKKFAILL